MLHGQKVFLCRSILSCNGFAGCSIFFFRIISNFAFRAEHHFHHPSRAAAFRRRITLEPFFPRVGVFFLKGDADVGLGCRFRTHLIHWPRNGKMRARSRWRGSKMRDFVPVVCGPVGATLVYFRIGQRRSKLPELLPSCVRVCLSVSVCAVVVVAHASRNFFTKRHTRSSSASSSLGRPIGLVSSGAERVVLRWRRRIICARGAKRGKVHERYGKWSKMVVTYLY